MSRQAPGAMPDGPHLPCKRQVLRLLAESIRSFVAAMIPVSLFPSFLGEVKPLKRYISAACAQGLFLAALASEEASSAALDRRHM